MKDIFELIPKDKFDISNIEELKIIEINLIEPILEELLACIQDMNWPIAPKIFEILPRFHSKLVPHIKTVFKSNDDEWKNSVLCLLLDFPVDTVKLFFPEIVRIAKHPTKNEIDEGTNEYAMDVIKKFNMKIE